jgi:hypothetical protein
MAHRVRAHGPVCPGGAEGPAGGPFPDHAPPGGSGRLGPAWGGSLCRRLGLFGVVPTP